MSQALDDFNLVRRPVEDAVDTIGTVGEGAVTAMAALGRQALRRLQHPVLGGAVSVGVPWSYMSPDLVVGLTPTNPLGVQQVPGSS